MSIPQDLAMEADAIGAGMEQAEAQGMQMMAPQGQFSALALNALVAQVNEILTMIGGQQPYPEFAEDVTVFPMEFVQVLMGIMSVAEEAGIPVEMSLADVISDNEVAKLSALLGRVAKAEEFMAFLEQAEAPVEEEEVITEEVVETPEGEVEMTDEELFASRMG
mgnify:FL=1